MTKYYAVLRKAKADNGESLARTRAATPSRLGGERPRDGGQLQIGTARADD